MRRFILLHALCLLVVLSAHAQGAIIHTGATARLQSDAVINMASGDLSIDGALDAGAGTVAFTGSDTQTLKPGVGQTLHRLTVDKPKGDLLLGGNLFIDGQLSIRSGDLDLNSYRIDLGRTGYLSEESGHTVKGEGGSITARRTLNGAEQINVAGLGAVISTQADMGVTVVTRSHAVQQVNRAESIARVYDIVPSQNKGFNATFVFQYDESELNGLSEKSLKLFQSRDEGKRWKDEGGIVNPEANTVTLNGIKGFARWTLSGRPVTSSKQDQGAGEEQAIATGDASNEAVAKSPEGATNMPESYLLTAPYPNPFNPVAQFNVAVREEQHVEVAVYDMLGRQVRALFAGPMRSGVPQTFVLEASDLPSGLYLIRATGETFTATRQAMLLK